MPVVINEFEVVADQAAPPATRSVSSSEAATNEQGRGATPHEVEMILQHEQERLARVKAH